MKREVAQKMPLVTRGWRQLADAELAEFGVSNSMAWCLIWLDRLGPEARQVDLAQAIGISQPSTVRVLNQLEAAGFTGRLQDPDDKRSYHLALTPAGAALVGKIEERLMGLRRDLFDDIADGEIASVLRVLDLLADRIADRRK